MLEPLRPALKAATIAAFVTGVVLMLVHPPSLDGVPGLVLWLAGGAAFVLLVAWATVTAIGRDGGMSEQELERLVRRSEELAARSRDANDATEFERIVADAIDRLPPEFQRLLERAPVVVSRRGSELAAYGRYYGDTVARGNYEPRIVIYQDTLERDFGWDPELLRAQVERTLRHELAHHLGWDEPGVRGLGL
ncbi:MAG: metallopeptidase family protein [Thermoleophilaceae bacterium]|nr:metallopeptidase family protein [Thermoleophilaceae bacterium]